MTTWWHRMFGVGAFHRLHRVGWFPRLFHRNEVPLYFITGADAINDLPDWHQPRELLASCHFIAARRQGTALDMAKLRGFFGSLCDAHIHELATPELEISSTQIRGRIREGRSIRYMVPESVETYIRKEGLYR